MKYEDIDWLNINQYQDILDLPEERWEIITHIFDGIYAVSNMVGVRGISVTGLMDYLHQRRYYNQDQLVFGVDQLVLPKEKMIEFLEKSLEMLKGE